jgi:hypothetical protein
LASLNALKQLKYPLENGSPLNEEFRDYLNDLQIKVSELHNDFSENWFSFTSGNEENSETAKSDKPKLQIACEA